MSVPEEQPRKQYAVGFMVNEARTHVVLIRKNRPAWQAGRLNGVGGKVEEGETSVGAMVREFYEETCCRTTAADWDHICTMTWPDADDNVPGKAPRIDFFRSVWLGGPLTVPGVVVTCTDEDVVVVPIGDLPSLYVIPNLLWLVPLAAYKADRYHPFAIVAELAEFVHPAVVA